MKKIISVLLALLCLCLTAAPVAFADNDPIKDAVAEELDIEISEPKAYGIIYQKGDAKTMYMPATTVGLHAPGYVRISKDEPIAIGKKFRCWKDSKGNDVFPGTEIYVDTMVYLTASWANDSTNVTALDTVICALKTMIHMLQVSIKVIDTANSYRPA